ncbi:hypothetical protein WJX73_007592 [Symbiochloris irregularis]|uniref:Guanylyl cyclase n=1 Tax=Symbiochloris irregularis TaxID=706552 RepID=A0AAW1PYA9_9CHLO
MAASASCTEVVLASSAEASCSSSCRQTSLQLSLQMLVPGIRFRPVPHVEQRFSWDCGLACTLMVLQAAGIGAETLSSLHRRCRTSSIWTIDLAHLLRHFHIHVQFLTQMVGANPAYADERFYMEQLQEDTVRVRHLFETASAKGIDLQCRSISAEELGKFLAIDGHVAIVLLDKGILTGSKAAVQARSCEQSESSYAGHYVVLTGFLPTSDRFLMLDPALEPAALPVSSTALDAARKAFGTDEDLLLIQLPTIFTH